MKLLLQYEKRKPNFYQTDVIKGFANRVVTEFSEFKKVKNYSRQTSRGALFADRLNTTVTSLLEKFVFEKSNANSVMEITSVTNITNFLDSRVYIEPLAFC